MEAEFISLMHAGKEALWLRNLLSEFLPDEIPAKLSTQLYCDNQGAITLTKDNKFHQWMKHIDIKFHNVRDMVEEKSIVIIRIPSEENVADALTKALGLPKFSPLVDKMGFTDEA